MEDRKGGEVKTILPLLLLFASLLPARPVRQTLTLAWSSDPAANIAGYNLYWGPGSFAYTNSVNTGTNRVVTVPSNGSAQFFNVTAYFSNKVESNFSIEYNFPGVRSKTPLRP